MKISWNAWEIDEEFPEASLSSSQQSSKFMLTFKIDKRDDNFSIKFLKWINFLHFPHITKI